MKVYIINKPINDNIYNSIAGQTGISIVSDIEIVEGIFDTEIPKRTRIAMGKEKCRKLAIEQGVDFVIIHDDDLLNLNNDNFIKAKRFLETNIDFGAVALSRNKINRTDPIVFDNITAPHICSGVIMIKKDALDKLSFGNSPDKPTCVSVSLSLRFNGLKYGYLDRMERIKHIKSN